MIMRRLLVVVLMLVAGAEGPALARKWTSRPGGFSVEAELVDVPSTVRDALAQHERDRTLLRCDLHDGAAQHLSAAMLQLQSLDVQGNMPAEARPHLREAMTLLSRALREIRDIIAERPLACSGPFEFLPSLHNLIRELVGTSGIEVELVDRLDRDALDSLPQAAIHRFLHEGLNNAIRHSHSARVRIEVAKQPGGIRLEIRDWGVGFVPEAVTPDHRGLHGIHERAELLGGHATVQTKPGCGTLLVVELPETFLAGRA